MSEPKRTYFASRALVIADVFKHTVGKERLEGGGTSYGIELSEPDGESTEGGKLAVQHIGLVPEDGGAGTLVIGTLFHLDKRCELRAYEHVADIYRQRFGGAPFRVGRGAYQALLAKVETFLAENRFAVSRVVPPAAAVAPASAPPRATGPRAAARVTSGAVQSIAVQPRRTSPWLGALVGACLALGGTVIFLLLRG